MFSTAYMNSTSKNSRKPSTSMVGCNQQSFSFSPYVLRSDDLYREIARARDRLASGEDVSSVLAPATTFHELFEAEVAKCGAHISSKQQELYIAATSWLRKIEAALSGNNYDDETIDLLLLMHDENYTGAESTAIFDILRDCAKNYLTACLSLHRTTLENKKILQEISSFADSKLQTSTSRMLQRLFEKEPWKSGINSSLIIVMSDIFDMVRSAEELYKTRNMGPATKWVAPSSFERSTTKYWVQDQKLPEVLLTCTPEAPLLVYGKTGRLTNLEEDPSKLLVNDKLWEDFSSSISSVYFDSPTLSLYKGRLARGEGAQLFRVRWYGNKPSGDKPIFLELKTHHEKWVNVKSIKERVSIKEKDMIRFLAQERWEMKDAEEMVLACSPNMKGKDLDTAADLLLRMHELVVKHKLRPCVRSVYSRLAFQSSKSNSLRLTVDRNVTLIDETQRDNSRSSPGEWCLSDSEAQNKSITKVIPFAVFEIKLSGIDAMPVALQQLEAKNIIEEAPKFSKFLSGAAVFNMHKIKDLPYWAEEPSFATLFGVATRGTSIHLLGKSTSTDSSATSATKTEDSDDLEGGKGIPFSTDNKKDTQEQRSPVFPWFSNFKRSSASQSHRIAPRKPARVEPKSYFANERTFIQWLSAAIMLVTISVLVYGYASASYIDDALANFARKCGLALCIGSVILVLYATFTYFRRIHLLATGSPQGYLDNVGPTVLATVVIAGVLVLLVKFSSIVSFYNMNQSYIAVEPGICTLNSNEGISRLEYQPSALIVDTDRDVLLVASLQDIIAIPRTPANSNSQPAARKLIEIPDTDLEGLTSHGDRIFALSEGPENTEVIELRWAADNESLSIVNRWLIKSGESQTEGIMYKADLFDDGKGKFFVDIDGIIRVYAVPTNTTSSVNDESSGSIIDQPVNNTPTKLERLSSLNMDVLLMGLNVDPKISELHYFEGVTYILHDNEMLLRAWDLERGELLAEIPLPHVANGQSKQWEGFALERRYSNQASSLDDETNPSYLRGGNTERDVEQSSVLIAHLALDTPPQVWSIVVEEGETPGSFIFPSCAAAHHYMPPDSSQPLA